MDSYKWKLNVQARNNNTKIASELLSEDEVQRAWNFHRSFDIYTETPLRNLQHLAEHLGISGFYVKDESYRFGLNAFKVLGGAYAIGRYLARELDMPIENLSFQKLQSAEVKRKLPPITFTSATDGNHGRGVAWAAQQLGQKAIIYMPKGSSEIRLKNILATGAEGYITDLNYDEAVRLSAENADKYGWVVIQDTAWEGYENIPIWIMQGYATLAAEALSQLADFGTEKPTHVFLQAGVGSYAASVQGLLSSLFGEDRPITVIVEPSKAECLYLSALADDGKPRNVTGDMDTIMAGLACGEPNPIAWDILYNSTDAFVSCPDYVAAHGMRVLGNPLKGDDKVVSGESGAVTTGLVSLLMRDPALQELREQLKLDADSKVLVISTEGDTDPVYYRKIVWDGLHPNF